MLDSKFGKDAQKFFPITAYDIDKDNIKMAKNGVFDVHKDELKFLRKNIGENLKKYFICHIDENELQGKLRLKEEYKSGIVYSESDILKDIDKIPAKNTVLLCRNFMPYMTIGETKTLVKQISKKLDSTSMIVLGKFEIDYGIEKLFEKEGFRHTEQYNVMEKLPYIKALLVKLKHKLRIK